MLCRSRQILSVLPGAFEVTLDFLSWEHFHRDSASEREKRVNEKLFLGAACVPSYDSDTCLQR